MSPSTQGAINPLSSTILAYYDSLESRIGYRLFLGDTRHIGYYDTETSWPWPINPALRRMEAKLMSALQCSRGAKVLDAGCGVGHVALFMAQKGGFRIEGVDITPRHIAKATRNIQRAGMSDSVSVRVGSYQQLTFLKDAELDGIYTMETFVHSPNPREGLREFLRVLKPGGRLAMHEYDHEGLDRTPKYIADKRKEINRICDMPAFESFERDDLKNLLQEAGFEDVQLTDMSKHIIPMLWLFYIFAFIPHMILKLIGLEYYLINTAAGAVMYEGRRYWRYVEITGKKPM